MSSFDPYSGLPERGEGSCRRERTAEERQRNREKQARNKRNRLARLEGTYKDPHIKVKK